MTLDRWLEAARETEPVSAEALARIERRGPPEASPSKAWVPLLAAAVAAAGLVVGLDLIRVAEAPVAPSAVRASVERVAAPARVAPLVPKERVRRARSEPPPPAPTPPTAKIAKTAKTAKTVAVRRATSDAAPTDASPALEVRPSEPTVREAPEPSVPSRVAPSFRTARRSRPKGTRRSLPAYQPRAMRELVAIGTERLADRELTAEVRRILALTDRRVMLANLDRIELNDPDLLALRGAMRVEARRCPDAMQDLTNVERLAPRSPAASYASRVRRWCTTPR